jgi:protein-S-isoprenylcysteine O-methyltransferase Ste14
MIRTLAFLFFSFAAFLAFWMAGQSFQASGWAFNLLPLILTGVHNAILAVVYLVQRPASSMDRKGLWLAWIAALLPVVGGIPQTISWTAFGICLTGYGFVFWSLLTLKSQFGMAPADRGLVSTGPYRWLRHPMYLGELMVRSAITVSNSVTVLSYVLLMALIGVQCWRAIREEQVISGYPDYADRTTWRLVPGIW